MALGGSGGLWSVCVEVHAAAESTANALAAAGRDWLGAIAISAGGANGKPTLECAKLIMATGFRCGLSMLHLATLHRPQCEQADPISMTFAPLFGPFRFTARSFCKRLFGSVTNKGDIDKPEGYYGKQRVEGDELIEDYSTMSIDPKGFANQVRSWRLLCVRAQTDRPKPNE